MPGLGSRKSRNAKTEKENVTIELLAGNNKKCYFTLVYYTSNKNIH